MALETKLNEDNSRNLVDREDYERERDRLKQRVFWDRFCLRLLLLSVFILLFRFGTFPLSEKEKINLWDEYAANFLREANTSFLLVIPALLATILLTILFSILYNGTKALLGKVRYLKIVLYIIGLIPSVLSSIPLFIIGIYMIQILHVDTVAQDRSFHLWGVIAIAAFNFNDFYRRSKQKIGEAYQTPQVLFARSLGIKESAILRFYVFPMAIRDLMAIIRELIPHLVAESIVIEYTFSFSALGRSVLMAIQYRDWYYFAIVMSALFLFIEFCDEIFRWIEALLLPSK